MASLSLFTQSQYQGQTFLDILSYYLPTHFQSFLNQLLEPVISRYLEHMSSAEHHQVATALATKSVAPASRLSFSIYAETSPKKTLLLPPLAFSFQHSDSQLYRTSSAAFAVSISSRLPLNFHIFLYFPSSRSLSCTGSSLILHSSAALLKITMSSSGSGSEGLAVLSAVDDGETAQTALSFLSLPPEIRLMVYDHLFVRQKRTSGVIVWANPRTPKLRFHRLNCHYCMKGHSHTQCHFEGYWTLSHKQNFAFEFSLSCLTSDIAFTCHTIWMEVLPILLRHMSIFVSDDVDDGSFSPFTQFLSNLRLPNGGLLPELVVSFRQTRENPSRSSRKPRHAWAKAITEEKISIAHLYLQVNTQIVNPRHLFNSHRAIRLFVDFLDSVDLQPATIRWIAGDNGWRAVQKTRFDREMEDFNKVVDTWLDDRAVTKIKNAHRPLLRDYLSKYYD
jgi:hypothetical protein